MGIEGLKDDDPVLKEESIPERETEQEERDRHDREIAEENRARQVRQGIVSDEPKAEQQKVEEMTTSDEARERQIRMGRAPADSVDEENTASKKEEVEEGK